MPGSTTNAAFSEYIYFDGKRAARRDYQSNVFYYFADQVGSARGMFEVLAGSHSASPPCFDADFYPFGGEHDFLNSCPQNYKFMGKERDPETNNDEFGARSYASAYGRFLSADWSSTPSPVPYANLTNPQTLNLYAMVSDNPESFADLDGHMWFPALGGCADSALGSCNPESDPGSAGQYLTVKDLPHCICDPTQEQKQNQDSNNKPDQQPSWDRTKPLPDDPSKLGPDWRKNDDHKHPHGEEYINDKTGEKIEWNKGRPGPWGPSSDRGKDGWHYTPPGGTRGKQLDPGAILRQYAPTVAKATIIISVAAIGHAIIDSAPAWVPLLIF